MQFMECPCELFASLVENKLKNKMNVVRLDQKIMAITNLHFNQEFLFLQVQDTCTLWNKLHTCHIFLTVVYTG
jgi:hypothetical protein